MHITYYIAFSGIIVFFAIYDYHYWERFRIEEEGYKSTPENVAPSPMEIPITPPVIVQTITVKELIEKNTAADLKVIHFNLGKWE